MKRLKSMIAVVACLTLLFTNVIPAMAATEEASPRVVVLQCLKCGGSITNPTVTREYLGTRWVPCTHKSGGQDLCHAYKVTVKGHCDKCSYDMGSETIEYELITCQGAG